MEGVAKAPVNHRNVGYAERWELLKDVMAELYLGDKKKKLKEIVEIMKSDYQFYASEPEYKRHFRLWDMKKAIPTKKKEKICRELETRAQQGKSSVVFHKGKVESQKIRRYLKEQTRQQTAVAPRLSVGIVDADYLSGHALQFGNRVFMNWNVPAAVLFGLKSKIFDHGSPEVSVGTPMSGVLVATPSSNAGPSPRNAPSPGNALSPDYERSSMTVAVLENVKINRAHLFVQKHYKDLLQGMTPQEQHVTTDWVHQFWQYSFTTARTWGRGPQTWNSSNLRFKQFSREGIETLATDSPERSSHNQSPRGKLPRISDVRRPSNLCRWSIHVRDDVDYDVESLPEQDEGRIDQDPAKEDLWKPWALRKSIHVFVESLAENLQSNKFSTIKAGELPLSSGQIARAAKRSPEQLLEEAFGFSIMARNSDLVSDMIRHIQKNKDFLLNDLHPYHLASSYLDGSKSCCDLFHKLMDGIPIGKASIRELYINHLNHTVLDNLMMNILKAHTSCTPIMVDDSFKNEPRFAGEEVDICGRWDADSDCIRYLQANGNATIPQNWKHMFCHTSAQAIVHSIGCIFQCYWIPSINTSSGLFLRRCLNETCGRKLQLKPLHTLVVIAVYVAQLGKDGETLFGMIACLLCLLSYGANPLLKADVSPTTLLSGNDSAECTHSELDPVELAEAVPKHILSAWSKERTVGWKIFCNILRISRDVWRPPAAPKLVNASPENFQGIYGAFVEDADEHIAFAGFPVMELDEEDENNKGSDKEDEDLDNGEGDDQEKEDFTICECSDQRYDDRLNYFRDNYTLATLWAAVQTELLTYRRIAEGDPWISPNFSMDSVLKSLENGQNISIGLVSNNMMKPFCHCGRFFDSDNRACLRVEEASTFYFSNLEDWKRSTFLDDTEYY